MTTEIVSGHGIVVATQNSVKGKIARSRHQRVVATQTLGDRKKLSRRESKWLATKTMLRQRNLVATHKSATEEKARSQHGIVVEM